MKYSALIVAAGKGTRVGLGYNKMFYFLRRYGLTVLEKVTQAFLEDPNCKQIVIVTNRTDMHKIVIEHEVGHIVHVNGGPTRQDSVFQGLMAVSEDVVLIHDGARPWIDSDSINRLLEVMDTEKAAILAVKTKDIIKEVEDGYITRTINKENYQSAQTPQAFQTSLIIDAYLRANEQGVFVNDDAQAIELMTDVKVRVVEGSYLNNKITTRDDLKGL